MTSVAAFDESCLPSDFGGIASKRWIEVPSTTKLYRLLLKYIAESAKGGQSYSAEVVKSNQKKSKSADEAPSVKKPNRIALAIGLGVFDFTDHKGKRLVAIHQSKGKPVGTPCGVDLFKSIIVVTQGSEEDLAAFFSDLVEASEVTEKGIIDMYNFNSKNQYWHWSSNMKARPLDSVVLPQRIKQQVIPDLENFLCEDMRDFYETHGIPYRRSYLLYGVPGSGKTSFIQAIAGHCERSISYLQIDPEMTDVVLRSAMDCLPSETVVVIEDIDALFDKNRSSKAIKGALTFSGLLNALDGVGCSSGQIFILTTNLRDQLDPALIRRGRVDVQLQFSHAEDEQVTQMWRSFYPAAADDADAFCAAARAALGGAPVTTAELQHFFVLHMRASPAEALADAAAIARDLKEKEAEAAKSAAAETVTPAADEAPNDTPAAAVGKVGAGAVHQIHLHLHSGEKTALTVVKGPERAATPEEGGVAAAASDSE